jgi:hypothetical protein
MFDKWQAPDRDSPSIEFKYGLEMTDQLKALLNMEGLDGYKEEAVKLRTGQDVSRPRRWHLMFERMGLLYRINDQTHLTDLGKELLRASSANPRFDLARKALRTLSRYQLKNPVDEEGGSYPEGSDLHPYWAIWKACDELDGKLHWDELNRELMRVLSHVDLAAAIEKIRRARVQSGYDPVAGGTAAVPLSARCYDNDSPPEGRSGDGQVRDQRTTPWFKRAGLGEYLLLSPGSQGNGYWSIRPEFRELIHDWVSSAPPEFRLFQSKDAWYRYISGEEVLPQSRPLTDFLAQLSAAIGAAPLVVEAHPLLRFTSSVLSKRFLILTGLAGSGKTKLAQAFARWLTKDPGWIDAGDHSKGKHANPCFALIPVGADWTGNDNILGYPNGLDSTNYITRPSLDLILQAQAKPDVPHFLILDEMNLSHVERYFADLLSLIESKESITLYCDKKGIDGCPEKTRGLDPVLKLPPNLFIIGTVNVDETTYMFSPKVLDRANVIEFRVSPSEMQAFLGTPVAPKLEELDGKGFDTGFAVSFVNAAKADVGVPAAVASRFRDEMNLFFALLQEHGAEFGYRVAHEAARFLHHYQTLGQEKVWDGEADAGEGKKGKWADKDGAQRDWFDHAFDATVIQKFLPKLHGSKVKLGLLLKKLYTASIQPPAAATRMPGSLVEPSREIPKDARYPLTAEKIWRFWRQLNENGFTSFPEN